MLYHVKNVLEIIVPLSGLYDHKFWEIQIDLNLCYDCMDKMIWSNLKLVMSATHLIFQNVSHHEASKSVASTP